MKGNAYIILIVFVLAGVPHAYGQITLPQIIRDSMVLQRDARIKIWGWASKGEKISVRFNNKKFKTTIGADGKWTIMLTPMIAGGPYTMNITGKNKIILNDILIGDVWFCSGQSNMVHQMNIHDVTYADEIASVNNPEIRQFGIPTLTNLEGPKENLPTSFWRVAVGEDIRPFSAVAYFFAKKINEKYHVPVGIINASVGGTPIEAWTSEEGLKDFSTMINTLQKNKDTGYVNNTNRVAMAASMAGRQKEETDKGLTGDLKWFEPSFVPTGWRTINIPGYWEDQGIKDLDGVLWYRKEIIVPASMTDKPAKIFLGRIVDADFLYINGKLVGNTTYQYPQRRYTIPQGLLKPGKNIFVLRVINNNGKGGFVPDKPYYLFAGKDTIDLKGYWQYNVGDIFIPRHPGPSFVSAQNQPTALYNAMVAPVTDYTIKGICWYQGESNAGRPEEYAKLLPALVNDWRHQWDDQSLPFIYAQLPNFMEVNYLPSESNWAVLRESQLKALSLPNTAMTVNIDLGEWNDIHPDNKKDVGERMATAALKVAYGENIVHSGPIYQSSKIEANKIILSFSNTGSGLVTNDGEELKQFAIAGTDKKFIWAQAKIEGDKVVVWNDEVKAPLYIRYAWADNPANPNLYNREGLPASPFRTDK